MPYTLWSRNRLLGETDLGFVYREAGFRCGWFHPSDIGERLMPSATGVAPALRAMWAIGPDATARADVHAAVDHERALDLELRGPDGAVIPTESIAIIDTHHLLSLARQAPDAEDVPGELDAEDAAEVEASLADWDSDSEPADFEPPSSEEVEFPRYQIQVRFIDRRWMS